MELSHLISIYYYCLRYWKHVFVILNASWSYTIGLIKRPILRIRVVKAARVRDELTSRCVSRSLARQMAHRGIVSGGALARQARMRNCVVNSREQLRTVRLHDNGTRFHMGRRTTLSKSMAPRWAPRNDSPKGSQKE